MKVGDIIELTVESLGFEGISIARNNGFVVHMRGALPGEQVRARIRRKKRSYAEAELVEILQPSPQRRQPPCPYAGDCGGCSWQFAHYDEQLRWKQQQVRDAFERIGHIAVEEYRPIIASPIEFGYRAKMEFTCSDRTWIPEQQWRSLEPVAMERKRPAIGLHVRGRFDAVLDIERCLLQDELANAILETIRHHIRSAGIACYNQRSKTGFLRTIVLRRSRIGEGMVVYTTTSPQRHEEEQFLERCTQELAERFAFVQSVQWALNDTPSPVPPGPYRLLHGHQYIRDIVAGIEFHISAQSFFQSNIAQVEQFIETVVAAAALTADEDAWDLYAGIGTLTLPLARRCRFVVGVESNAAATEDAMATAARNEIKNAQFLATDLHTPAGIQTLDGLPNPQVVVIDPPRAGMHARLVEYVLHRAPERIVYVSCNPTTQARDIALMSERYRVRAVQPIDMFPQTYHVENVAILERR
ncbi:MAG: 23S rRNA (uracil-5-)-methyltransferase RumA [Candidatus Kapaibacterium sp.]|nr:MAG: 23S rRNA (uracil-5-)-methyltransferase RumA [Candidatus Kapabacteria bacterium]